MILDLDMLKAHLNITFSDDDHLLEQKSLVAELAVANLVGFSLEERYPDGAPAPLVEAVMELAAAFYENREAYGANPALGRSPLFDETIAAFREWSF